MSAPKAYTRVLTICLSMLAPTLACSDRAAHGYYGTIKPRHPANVLWTNNGSEPEYIDPGKCSESAGGVIVRNLFAGLTQAHPKTLDPMPDIAEGWDISDDGRVYTFYLRPSQWSDGTPLTAHDFEWSWKRVLAPETQSKYASFLWFLKNAEGYSRQALWVTGLPDDVAAKDIEQAFSQVVEVERAELVQDPAGALVFLSESEKDKLEARKRAIEHFHQKAFPGRQGAASLHVTVADRSLVGARALDDLTFEATLKDPLPYFLDSTHFYTTMPVPRHVLERLERTGQNTDLWTRPEHIVSNGAFVLDAWKFRQEMVLRKNPRYWDAGNTRLDEVRVAMVENYNTTLNLYKAGELDYIGENSKLPNEFLDHLSTYKDYYDGPYLGVYFYWFNTQAPGTDHPLVRQALSLAVDRASLVKNVLRAGQIPLASMVPDGLAGYEALNTSLFDAEEAKRLLAQAGYPGGKGLPPITLMYNTSEGHKQIAEAIQQMWKQHLGVSVTIENQEWKVYLKNLNQEQFQIARMGWIGDYPDPYTFLELFTSGNGNNHSGWKSATYDAMLREANGLADPQARLAKLREAESLLLEAQPMLPIYLYTRSDMWKPYLKGIWSNFQNHHPLKFMWIDERFYDGIPGDPDHNPPPPVIKPISRRSAATTAQEH